MWFILCGGLIADLWSSMSRLDKQMIIAIQFESKISWNLNARDATKTIVFNSLETIYTVYFFSLSMV